MTDELKHPYRESQEPSERPETKTMNLESVLTVSAETYCKANGRELGDYFMVGVNGQFYKPEQNTHLIKVPYLTEIVVDFLLTTSNCFIFYFGTALIPRKLL